KDGLIVPVLRNADTLGLREIRTSSDALYQAARQEPPKLSRDQMTGGTFTISNLGMYGVRQFDAVLNLPQVGILAVGAAEKRASALLVFSRVGSSLTTDGLPKEHHAIRLRRFGDRRRPCRLCGSHPGRAARQAHALRRARQARRHLPELGVHPDQGAADERPP